jgi:hypothetical protein
MIGVDQARLNDSFVRLQINSKIIKELSRMYLEALVNSEVAK